jgi:protein-tyrosine-phosphatase
LRPAILFVCVENSCRSQIAEAYARSLAGPGGIVASAGSQPAEQVHPRAIAFMLEEGIELTAQRPKGLGGVPSLEWDALVTMGCGDACPSLPARRRWDWELPDPKDLSDEEFRNVRDEIRRRVGKLLLELEASAADR